MPHLGTPEAYTRPQLLAWKLATLTEALHRHAHVLLSAELGSARAAFDEACWGLPAAKSRKLLSAAAPLRVLRTIDWLAPSV